MTYTRAEKCGFKKPLSKNITKGNHRKLSRAKNKTKAFWDFVKGSKKITLYPSQIADPTSKSNLLDTKIEINEALKMHFWKHRKRLYVIQIT